MSQNREVISVDSDGSEVECTGMNYARRPQARQVASSSKNRLREPDVIVLSDDSNDVRHKQPSSSHTKTDKWQNHRDTGAPSPHNSRQANDRQFRDPLTRASLATPTQERQKRKKPEEHERDARVNQKGRFLESLNAEEDYDNLYFALDDSARNWKPFRNTNPDAPLPDNVPLVRETPSTNQRCHVSCHNPTLHHNLSRRFEQPSRSPIFQYGNIIWTSLRNSFPVPASYDPSLGIHRTRETLGKRLLLHDLHCSKYFREAPGAIQKVTQSSGIIAFCGATLGGLSDEENEEPNIYNGPGSLMVCYQEQEQIIRGHERPRNRRLNPFYKHYAVNDVVLNSTATPTYMVSSGCDGYVRFWSCTPDTTTSLLHVRQEDEVAYKKSPLELAFKPEQDILAVACRDGNVYVYPQLRPADLDAQEIYPVAPHNTPQAAGAMTWGTEATSHHLFASSEPYNDNHNSGYHRAFDLNLPKQHLYEFDAGEAGDAIALNCRGDQLALLTRGRAGCYIMRLYDVGRQSCKAVWESNLEPFPANLAPIGSVNHARFSPDAIYLALARNDDIVHVYDCRMIGRGILHAFEHTKAHQRIPRMDFYGVVDLQWRESHSRRMGLVTGGGDGKIRLWDVGKASDDPANGVVIAEAASDIGHFSLGDVDKGEKALVVGDCDGCAYIYDNIEPEI